MAGELCGLRAGLSLFNNKSKMDTIRKVYPPKCWDGMQEVGKGTLINSYHNVHADLEWYGCQSPAEYKEWSRREGLVSVGDGVKARVHESIQKNVDSRDATQDALNSLDESWNAFETRKVISADLEVFVIV